jgi:hypothetical protein
MHVHAATMVATLTRAASNHNDKVAAMHGTPALLLVAFNSKIRMAFNSKIRMEKGWSRNGCQALG